MALFCFYRKNRKSGFGCKSNAIRRSFTEIPADAGYHETRVEPDLRTLYPVLF